MAVDVSREHCRKRTRNVTRPNDIARCREGEVGGTDGRAFETVMQAQQTRPGPLVAPARLLESVDEARTNIATLVRETRERDRHVTQPCDERTRSIKDVNSRMRRKARVRQT